VPRGLACSFWNRDSGNNRRQAPWLQRAKPIATENRNNLRKINRILIQSTRGKYAGTAEAELVRERRCPTSINRITDCVMRRAAFTAVSTPVLPSLRRTPTDTASIMALMIVAANIKTLRHNLRTRLAVAACSGPNLPLLTPEGTFASARLSFGLSSERS
jgi:hypothetical protein